MTELDVQLRPGLFLNSTRPILDALNKGLLKNATVQWTSHRTEIARWSGGKLDLHPGGEELVSVV
jgi:hypothetical protein